MNDLTVKLSKTINAPIQKVFNAWLKAETLSQFMIPMPGMVNPRVEANGIQGGNFTIYMIVGEEEIPHRGEYLEISRYDKLVFSWESPFSPAGSTVTIEFTPVADEQTLINFKHVKFMSEETRSNHEGGWTLILSNLDKILSEAECLQEEAV